MIVEKFVVHLESGLSLIPSGNILHFKHRLSCRRTNLKYHMDILSLNQIMINLI